MRPPILTKYPVEELVSNLKDSKDSMVWVTRFIPQILNKQKIHANAISLMKRISLFKKQPFTDDDIQKLKNHLDEIGRDDLACVRQVGNKKDNVLLYCTGGIRCEKASAYLLKIGFKDVSHLKGGIIKYLEKVSKEDSKWEGECFVFDNRVSIEQDLTQGNYLNCNGCGKPLRKEEVTHPKYKKGVSCPKCYDNLTKEKIESSSERQKQVELSEKRGEVHIGE